MKLMISAVVVIALAFGFMVRPAKAAATAGAAVVTNLQATNSDNADGGNSGEAHETNPSANDDDVVAGKGKQPKSKKDKDKDED